MRQNLFTIAPHAPFLPTLADAILDGRLTGQKPVGDFGLADITVIVPNARARNALAGVFADRLGATLLPDIRSLGDGYEEEDLFLPPFEAPPDADPISALSRRLVLARLVAAKLAGEASGLPGAGEVLALADSLGELLDDFLIEEIDPGVIGQVPPENLAAGFQANLKFLDILLTNWPDHLREHGLVEGARRRSELLHRQAAMAPLIYGDRPVIAAGSTGSMPATSALLKAISSLPQGVLVLPGLDTGLTNAQADQLGDEALSPHGASQYGLVRLLRQLGRAPQSVDEIAANTSSRTQAVRAALAPIAETANWPQMLQTLGPEALQSGFADVDIGIAAHDEEQARAIALVVHDALRSEKSVGIISPDQTLARRIGMELSRFDIAVDDSAGTPLFQSRAGRLARELLALAMGDFAPVDLMALLRNRYLTMGMSRAEITRLSDWLEMGALRGHRVGGGARRLRAAIEDNVSKARTHVPLRLAAQQVEALGRFVDRLENSIAPLTRLLARERFFVPDLVAALKASFDLAIEGQKTGQLPPGFDVFDRWAADALQAGSHPPLIHRSEALDALNGLMRGQSVRAAGKAEADVAIWGLIEARLQMADVMILAGLNEGVWPETADPGPWMSRGMRMAAGLQPPERRQGQAAHDFEMAMGARSVMLFASARRGGAPVALSRLVQRLEGFVGETLQDAMRARGARWIGAARSLDAVELVTPASRPAPCPPVDARPKALSITEVEALIQSPYEIYAKHTLGLRPLDPLGEDAERRDRGNLIHEVLDRFLKQDGRFTAPDAVDQIMSLVDEQLEALDDLPARKARYRHRLEAVILEIVAWERERDPDIAERHSELRARLDYPFGETNFRLHGRADRIDILTSGMAEIIDFKTGNVPKPARMKELLAPQLPLEGALLSGGGFDGIGPHGTSDLYFLKLGFGPNAFEVKPFVFPDGMAASDAVEKMEASLLSRVDAMLMHSTAPMVADELPPEAVSYHRPFQHLSRRAEWAGVVVDDDEGGV